MRHRFKPGRRRQHVKGEMNSTEKAYSEHLEGLRLQGLIHGWQFEPIKLRLADLTYYSPDFMVQAFDETIELHEVKACMKNGKFLFEDDARVKIKVAAEMHPVFAFIVAGKLPKASGGGWKFEVISKGGI